MLLTTISRAYNHETLSSEIPNRSAVYQRTVFSILMRFKPWMFLDVVVRSYAIRRAHRPVKLGNVKTRRAPPQNMRTEHNTLNN
jgi:hypothetical protein